MSGLLAEAAAAALTRGTEALLNRIDVAEINRFNFQSIVDHVSNQWANRARLSLVEIELSEGRAKEALELCEKILAGEGVSRVEIQKMMGRAYEQLGEDALAARCYAGELPIP